MNSRIATFLMALFFSLQPLQADAPKPIPPNPKRFVYDETSTLKPSTLSAVESLLIEHHQLTGEQVVVGVFKEAKDQNFHSWIQQLFESWEIGAETSADNGILLAIDGDAKKADIIEGYGLENDLPEATQDKILAEYIRPELKKGSLDSAVTVGTFVVLEALNSPLILSGKAEEILQMHHLATPAKSLATPPESFTWVFVLALGILALLGAFFYMWTKRSPHWIESILGWIPGRPKNLLSHRDISSDSSSHGDASKE